MKIKDNIKFLNLYNQRSMSKMNASSMGYHKK